MKKFSKERIWMGIDCIGSFQQVCSAFPLKNKETDQVCLFLVELFSKEEVPEILPHTNTFSHLQKLKTIFRTFSIQSI